MLARKSEGARSKGTSELSSATNPVQLSYLDCGELTHGAFGVEQATLAMMIQLFGGWPRRAYELQISGGTPAR